MMPLKDTILIVDDEPGVRQVLSVLLKTAGYEPIMAATGSECLRLAYERRPNLVLLDIMMAHPDGREVCQRLREISDMPIIMLTALSDAREKVDRLSDGADDYITKPFYNEELLARIRAVLRRTRDPNQVELANYQDGYLDVDFESHQLCVEGVPVSLSPKQWLLLECLIGRKDHIVLHEELLRYAWGKGYEGEHKYLKVFMSNLRKRLGDVPGRRRYIRTERERGYLFQSYA